MNSGSDSDSNSAASGYGDDDDDDDDDDNGDDQLTDNVAAVLPPMSEYELLRQNNILLNNAKLKELNFEPHTIEKRRLTPNERKTRDWSTKAKTQAVIADIKNDIDDDSEPEWDYQTLTEAQ